MHQRLYYHRTIGGAEYLTDRWERNPDGSLEGVFRAASIIVRIDGDITKDAEITVVDDELVAARKQLAAYRSALLCIADTAAQGRNATAYLDTIECKAREAIAAANNQHKGSSK